MRAAEIPVLKDESLHLRPMQALTELATAYRSSVSITRGNKKADAKSILDVMMLAAERGPLRLETEGDDADEAMDALVKLLDRELNKK